MAMYDFVDTVDELQVSTDLPAEALSINGEWIENLIPEYRTLHVSGRELLGSEIDDYEIGNVNGTKYRGKRYPARTITVTYQIIAKTSSAFRQAYNKLNAILDVEEARLIFADEPDKYFIGTKAGNNEVDAGSNSVIGEIEFYCADPFKYSAAEKSFTAAANDDGILEMKIINDGSVAVPISYEITHNHENGYIGIVSTEGVMEFGDINEENDASETKTELLINYGSTKEGTDFSEMEAGKGSHQTYSDITINGTWRTVTENIGYWWDDKTATQFLTLASTGNSNGWNGAVRSIEIPADSMGVKGATYWQIDFSVWFDILYISQTGALELCVADASGDYIMSIDIYKASRTAQDSNIRMYLADGQMATSGFSPAKEWSPFRPGAIIRVQKSGKNFSMSFDGKKYTLSSSVLENKVASSVSILLYSLNNYGVSGLPEHMYFYSMKFYKNNVTYYYDVPNRYQEGDVLRIDGSAAKPYLNELPVCADEVIGTKYFKAPPGETVVQFYFSDFCTPPPTVKASIREAYI